MKLESIALHHGYESEKNDQKAAFQCRRKKTDEPNNEIIIPKISAPTGEIYP